LSVCNLCRCAGRWATRVEYEYVDVREYIGEFLDGCGVG
jgi:hypothetical protein